MKKSDKKPHHSTHLFKKKNHAEKQFGPIEIIIPEDAGRPNPPTAETLEEANSAAEAESVRQAAASEPHPAASPETSSDNYRWFPNRKYFTICIYALFLVAASALIVYAIVNLPTLKTWFKQLLGILSPFLVAFFIAYILNPLVKRLDQQLFGDLLHWKPSTARLLLSLVLSYLAVIGLVTVALLYVFPQIGTSIMDLTNRIPDLVAAIIEFIEWLELHFPELNLNKLEEYLTMSVPDLIAYGTSLVKNVVPVIVNVGVRIVRLAINLLLAIVISCYMLFDKRLLARNACRLLYAFLPPAKAKSFTQTASECNQIFSGFIVGKSIDSLIIGILCFILMTIFRFPYAVLLSVIVGVTNMIPYFGPFIGAVPGVVLYLCIDPVQAVLFGFMIFVLQQFDGWFLGPKILGNSTGLTPLWVIFAITVGGSYFGVLGMFLGVPVVAVIAHLCSKWLDRRLKKRDIKIR